SGNSSACDSNPKFVQRFYQSFPTTSYPRTQTYLESYVGSNAHYGSIVHLKSVLSTNRTSCFISKTLDNIFPSSRKSSTNTFVVSTVEVLKKVFKSHTDDHKFLSTLIPSDLTNYNPRKFINCPSWNRPTFYDDDDEEYTIQYREYLENSSKAIAPDLPTEEPDNSLRILRPNYEDSRAHGFVHSYIRASYPVNSQQKSLPFFKTLKKCTRKSDFLWTTEAEAAFKEMKKLIAELPTLTVPMEREELIVYHAVAREAVSAVLMTEREAKQIPVYFVSRALHGPEINYTSMEKLVLALGHASKWIKRPRMSVKAQILADFIVERLKDDPLDTPMEAKEELWDLWTLFTDRSSYVDGSGAGLILTNPKGA
ncbi:reverse transcriptase domain-containing protein, partial [Tanacetum coccineum]